MTDGFHIPLSDGCVDIVISNQVIEHLHPDDAADQLGEILRVLRKGGSYICITPNRLHGPYDISGHYDPIECPVIDGAYIANGLHLKEYTNVELSDLFKVAGFRQIRHFAGARGKYVQVPAGMLGLCEKWARHVPLNRRKRSKLFRALLGVRIVADK